jgi:hypothetical protein
VTTKRILLRAWKGPFSVVSPAAALDSNLIGNNAGNLIFSNAAYKLLWTSGTEVVASGPIPGRAAADRINEEFDVFVVPLANAFRRSFLRELGSLTALIRGLKIPVVVLGVGAQSTVDYDLARLAPLRDAVRGFAAAVLDRSPSIGVRGDFTGEYLRSLGFDDVDMIGCPSLFMDGDALRVDKRVAAIGPDSAVCLNVSPYVRKMGDVVQHHQERYSGLRYVAQDRETLRTLLRGDPPSKRRATSLLPVNTTHALFRQDRIRFFVDPPPWIDYLRGFDVCFGTRIHGNIAGLLAGTPSYVLAHDSRTLELARYFQIPHRTMARVGPDTDVRDLYEEADFTAFNAGHAGRFTTFTGFLAKHGLHHVFETGEDPERFEQMVRTTRYPAAVGYHPLRPVLHSVHRARGKSRQLARAAVRLGRTGRQGTAGGSKA